jgi:hypothetical protein
MGEKGKILIKTKRKKYINIRFASDFKFENFESHRGFENTLAVAQEKVPQIEELETNLMFSDMIDSANLDIDEKVLLNFYMQRDNIDSSWNTKYIEYHKEKFGNKITKQAVYNRLFRLQRKIWNVYTKKFNIPFYDNRFRFINNSNTRKSQNTNK